VVIITDYYKLTGGNMRHITNVFIVIAMAGFVLSHTKNFINEQMLKGATQQLPL